MFFWFGVALVVYQSITNENLRSFDGQASRLATFKVNTLDRTVLQDVAVASPFVDDIAQRHIQQHLVLLWKPKRGGYDAGR